MQSPSSDQESSDDEDDYQGTLYTDDSASDNDDDDQEDASDDDHQIAVLPLPLLPIFPVATITPLPTPTPVPVPVPGLDYIGMILAAVRGHLASGHSIGPIMQIIARCVGEHLQIPLTIDDMLALYGVYPRINERLEYIAGRALAIEIGIAPPATFHSMKLSSESLCRALQKASDDSVSKKGFAAQQSFLYAALMEARRVYKPLTGKGLDLVSVDFVVDTLTGIGKLVIHLYEMKDHKRMYPKGVLKAVTKLVAECLKLRKLLELTYSALVAGNILADTEYLCTVVINGVVGPDVHAQYTEEGQVCSVIHGSQVRELILPDQQLRTRYSTQIRRAANDHA